MRLRIILACFVLGVASLAAQTFRGTVLGTITDPSGAVVSGATVAVRNVNTGQERTTQTSADGSYSVPELPIGSYTVTVTQSGFQTSVTKGVVVDVASERRVDVVLQAGQVSQTVEVSGEELPQVDTTTAQLGGTLTSDTIANLPVNGRDYTKLIYFDLKDAMFIYDAEQPVLNALMARKITYGKAARDIYNIESEGQARRARDWPQAAQAQARAQQNTAAKAALQQVNRKCLDLIAPFRNGVLDGKIPLGDDAVTPAMLAYNATASDAEAAALSSLIGARQACLTEEVHFAQAYLPWFQPIVEFGVATEISIYKALIARRSTFAEAGRQFAGLIAEISARTKAAREEQARQAARPAAGVPSEQDVAGALH